MSLWSAGLNALIIGFNVRPTAEARSQAETDDVEVRLHSIMSYKVIEEMEDAMKGMLILNTKKKSLVKLIVRETFKVSKVGTIGGFMVIRGKIPVIQVFVLFVMELLYSMVN